jgi:transposase
MTNRTEPIATNYLQRELAVSLELEAFNIDAYHDRTYLTAALEAGFDVAALAQAYDVSKKTIYRALDEYDIEYTQPPKSGPARRLWNTHPDAVPGDD